MKYRIIGILIASLFVVPDAVGAAAVQRLMDRAGPESLAGMDGHVLVVVHHMVEGLQVVLGRIVLLDTSQIERHHALALPGHGQLRQLQRQFGLIGPQAGDDDARTDRRLAARLLQSLVHGDHRIVG